MDIDTVQQLNRLNQHFYATVANDFDKTRQQPWQGWIKVVAHSACTQCQSVIDIGCGNGRFANFVTDKNMAGYLGLDNNPGLLKQAQQYAEHFDLFRLKSFDLINALIDKSASREIAALVKESGFKKPLLITLFGVIHHVPSKTMRQTLLNEISKLMTTNDVAVISCWQFDRIPSLIKRQINPTQLEIKNIEEGDYILDWQRGTTAFRYCHLVTEKEMKELTKNAQLEIIASWDSDGKTNNLNTYYLLQKK
jgi:SAM-dependent methyltransferase